MRPSRVSGRFGVRSAAARRIWDSSHTRQTSCGARRGRLCMPRRPPPRGLRRGDGVEIEKKRGRDGAWEGSECGKAHPWTRSAGGAGAASHSVDRAAPWPPPSREGSLGRPRSSRWRRRAAECSLARGCSKGEWFAVKARGCSGSRRPSAPSSAMRNPRASVPSSPGKGP